MADINSRIEKVVEDSGLSKTAFGDRINVSQQYVSKLTKMGNPSDSTIADICREFNVNEEWLRTGNGEMYIKKLPTDEVAEYVETLLDNPDDPFTDLIVGMMKTYYELDEKSKTVARAFFQKLKDNIKKEGD